MSYRTTIDFVVDGEPGSASVLNRPASQIRANVDYLKARLDAAETGTSLVRTSVVFKSDVSVGNPVYYNSTNNRFELAKAEDGLSDCVGLCLTKDSPTSGDLLLSGFMNLSDWAPIIDGSVDPGRYFLSDTTAGQLTATRPDDIQVSVLILDDSNNAVVFPHENISVAGSVGPAGQAGATGSTGAAGPASYLYRHKSTTSWHLAGQFTNELLTQTSAIVDKLIAVPIDIMQGGTIDRLEIEVTLSGLSGSDIRVNLYDSTSLSTGNLYPNARLVADLGGVNCTSPGIKTFTTSIVVPANTLIWAVIGCGSSAPGLRAIDSKACRPLLGVDKSGSTFTAPGYGYLVDFTYDALPSTFPGSASIIRTGALPAIAFRFSS